MKYIENARKLRPIVEQAVQSLPDDKALQAVQLHPVWTPGTDCAAGYKVQRSGKLFKALQAHTTRSGWEPENAPSLWEQINEINEGTREDPIPYSGNMVLESGKYYIQNGVIYLCNRDTVNPVYNALDELIGLFVEIA